MPASIRAIAQTSDGRLWIGTELGLQQFDGIRFRVWNPPANEQLPSDYIMGLAAARNVAARPDARRHRRALFRLERPDSRLFACRRTAGAGDRRARRAQSRSVAGLIAIVIGGAAPRRGAPTRRAGQPRPGSASCHGTTAAPSQATRRIGSRPQISPRAATSASMSPSLCWGLGVKRNLSPPRGTVG